ncbi:AMP-binding protein [Nitratireductor soli]|uniref:AMP-binding protein n=1 Tax=Nitratireductor soli TaxID=1670619 RepID=UPI00065E46C6|nr:AMP-binding protein [Nitratireductor soli]
MPFHLEIDHHAAVTPDKPAFVLDGQIRTYADLASRSRSFASYIATLPGTRDGQSVPGGVRKITALDLGNHPLFAELFVGATTGKNACAVLDPTMPATQLEEILTRLRPDLIVTGTMNSNAAKIAARMGLAIELASSFDRLAQGDQPAAAGDADVDADGDDTFLVSFTSGTTALPKAYSRSRASWRASFSRGRSLFGLENGPTTCCPGALAHGLALYALAEALHSGGTFHSIRQWQAEGVADLLSREGIQRFVAVPTMISGLAKTAIAKPGGFPMIRNVLTAGSKLGSKQVGQMRAMFPNARIMEYYGASELGFISVSTVVPFDAETPLQTVGKPFPGVGLSIRNSGGQVLGPGEVGTIHVHSDLICDGYLWGDDGKAFRADAGGATVGDIGELDGNGALRVIGREGGMVVTGGFNVYPSEIETALRNIADVDEAVVLGVEDDHLGTRLVAVLSGSFEDGDGVLSAAGTFLPRYKLPRNLFRTQSWPVTTSGKIARGKVAEALRKGQYAAVETSS